ncbi:MAG TPA: 2-C-methyl-D-erythritol 4-phosphate cytidylyltransferase [Bacteroidales bacterium]|nr:2-C-methyl-D-erythritol 4-phosphate cytidylyltransferase [Bacteroidales bacterium]HRZ48792.1 2-C-methyl-D-erythritol 4-phosphate cytidylyltransferase [Bacteroidales bacterium]
MERYVIIVAGGSGTRMQSGLPKQFIPVAEKPILMHTMAAFKAAYEDIRIVTVLPEKFIKLWKEMCTEFSFSISHSIATGGETRFQSVRHGLRLVPEQVLVGVHDGVRPFVSVQTIRAAFETAEATGAAVPVVEIHDSVRQVLNGASVPADRSAFRIVQTPQCFQASLLKQAYQQKEKPEFTDDASVVEAVGHPVTLTPGNYENIKITRTIDLAYAEVLSKKRFNF